MDFPKVGPKEFIVLEELAKSNTGKRPKRVLKKQLMKKIKDDSSKRKIKNQRPPAEMASAPSSGHLSSYHQLCWWSLI